MDIEVRHLLPSNFATITVATYVNQVVTRANMTRSGPMNCWKICEPMQSISGRCMRSWRGGNTKSAMDDLCVE
jgi:hypothetical protein